MMLIANGDVILVIEGDIYRISLDATSVTNV